MNYRKQYLLIALSIIGACVFPLATAEHIPAQTLTGTGSTGSIPKWTDPDTIGESIITENAGKIGVSSPAPGFKFEIKHNSPSVLGIINTQPPSPTSGGGISGFTSLVPSDAHQRLGFYTLGVRIGTTSYNPVAIEAYSNQPWTLANARGTFLRFLTTANDSTAREERMRIAANGYVGIGNPNPRSRLDVITADDNWPALMVQNVGSNELIRGNDLHGNRVFTVAGR